MLSGQVLNSDAQLNNFIVTQSQSFMPGETIKLVVRIVTKELNSLRYIPASTAVVTFHFNKTDGTTLDKVSTFFTDDRSMRIVNISATESADLLGGNFSFEVDEAGDGSGNIYLGSVELGLARYIEGEC